MHPTTIPKTSAGTDPCTEALHVLETCLETPVVPGELSLWLGNVRSSLDRVFEELPRAQTEQGETRAQIEENDVALTEPVRDLERTEGELRDDARRLLDQVTRAQDEATAAGGDEARLAPEVGRVTEAGLALVVGLRRQAIATRTWLTEALGREGGVAG